MPHLRTASLLLSAALAACSTSTGIADAGGPDASSPDAAVADLHPPDCGDGPEPSSGDVVPWNDACRDPLGANHTSVLVHYLDRTDQEYEMRVEAISPSEIRLFIPGIPLDTPRVEITAPPETPDGYPPGQFHPDADLPDVGDTVLFRFDGCYYVILHDSSGVLIFEWKRSRRSATSGSSTAPARWSDSRRVSRSAWESAIARGAAEIRRIRVIASRRSSRRGARPPVGLLSAVARALPARVRQTALRRDARRLRLGVASLATPSREASARLRSVSEAQTGALDPVLNSRERQSRPQKATSPLGAHAADSRSVLSHDFHDVADDRTYVFREPRLPAIDE